MNWIVGFIAPKYLGNVIRHGTNAAGTWLIAVAKIDPAVVDSWIAPTNAILTGLAMIGLSLLASLANSKGKK